MAGAPFNPAKRRSAQIQPPNRYHSTYHEADRDQLEYDDARTDEARAVRTEWIPDQSKTILAQNDSPDVGFRYSINPYRGCEHGCSYCYARPGHEMLGFSAGLDFETTILVKHRAAELLRRELRKPSWQPQPIALSGVTDCYQPAERKFRITRSCLEVLCEARNPAIIITKNARVLRDLDVLRRMAEHRLVHVRVSITTLDAQLARTMEPRTSLPQARLDAVRRLHAAGVPVGIMLAPVIPGINETEIPAVLEAAKQSGAASAAYILVRLPLTVQPVFLDWLERNYPLKRQRVESMIRDTRGGRLNDSNFRSRMRGSGLVADQLAKTFKVFSKKLGLDRPLPELDCSCFGAPGDSHGQRRLF